MAEKSPASAKPPPFWFPILGSLFSIVLIAFVVGRDDNNNYKTLNTFIVVTQSLMLLLLWTTNKFRCGYVLGVSYIVWAWFLLFLILAICVYFRFEDDKSKGSIYIMFACNLFLLVPSLVMLKDKACPWRKPPVQQETKSPDVKRAASPLKLSEEEQREVTDGWLSRYEELSEKVRQGSTSPYELKQWKIVRDNLESVGELPPNSTQTPLSTVQSPGSAN